MTKPGLEVEELVEALRADLPTDQDRERVRARLIAAGVAVSASVAASSTSVAAAAGGGASGAAAGSAKAGLLSQLAGLSLAAKVSIVTTVVAVSMALPMAAKRMHDAPAREAREVEAVKAHAHRSEARAIAPVEPPVAQRTPSTAMLQVDAPATIDHAGDVAASPAPMAVAARMHAAPRASRTPAVTEARAVDEATPNTATPAAEPVAPAPVESVPRAPTAEVATTPHAPAASMLNDEADLLERALSALRRGDRAHARQALDLHARRYAHGALAHERERILQRVHDAP